MAAPAQRRRQGRAKVLTGELATIAAKAIADARHVAANSRRGLRRKGLAASGKVAALVAELERTAELVERVAAQTRTRLAGEALTARPGW